jgi:PAS domain S-box-containing protein
VAPGDGHGDGSRSGDDFTVSGSVEVSAPPPTDDDALADRPPVPVLIVDDDYAKRFALKRLLSPLGYDIVEADSGLAALRCVLSQDFAAILLDVRMPGMDGFETAALIRTRQRSELTPIILTTASTSDEIVASGLHGDKVTDLMFAPLVPDELRVAVSVFGNLFLKAQELASQTLEVQASADRWRLLAEAAPVGIFQTDRHHHYTYTNPRWTEITGIPAGAAFGQDWRVIVDAEQASRLVVGSGAEVAARAEVSHRIEIAVPGGDPRMVLLTSKLIPDGDGGIAGWVGTLADVTEMAALHV